MKMSSMRFVLLLSALAMGNAADYEADSSKPIARVVKLLKDMSEKGEADSEAEAATFEKVECYCGKTVKEKEDELSRLTELIDSGKNGIDKHVALQAELTAKEAKLQKDIQDNNDSLVEALATRAKERKAFLKEEAEMNTTINGLNTAIQQIEAAGAAASSKNSDTQLLEVTKTLEQASAASTSFLAPRAKTILMSLREAPGGTDSISPMLKNTRDTYLGDIDKLRESEAGAQEASEKMAENMKTQAAQMSAMLVQVQESLATTMEEITSKKEALANANTDFTNTQAVKASTEKTCAEKRKVIEETKLLRSQEQAAIAKAIAVLNSDSAFSTFLKTDSTGSDAALAQFSKHAAVHRHVASEQSLKQVAQLLRKLAHDGSSSRLARVAAFATGNPLEKVLEEISTMKARIQEEEAVDKKQLNWCAKEKKENDASSLTKAEQVTALESSITSLQNSLESPVDGMKVTLETATTDLKENQEDQAKETEMRKTENVDYQKSIANLQEAQRLIEQGTAVLKKYYDSIAADIALVQVKKEEPTKEEGMPEIGGPYNGQSEAGGNVLSLLADVLANSKEEEKAAHTAESAAQASFEESMAALTEVEKSLSTTIADSTKNIADTNLELDSKKAELSATDKEKASIDAYVKDLTSQCKFINTNFDIRVKARAKELDGLERASELLKATPANSDA